MTSSRRLVALCCCLLALGSARAQEEEAPSKYPPFERVTKGAEKIDGLFTFYFNKDEQRLLLELGSRNLGRDYLLPISIARGSGMQYLGGNTLNFGAQWIIRFQRVADRVLVVRPNIRHIAKPGTPQADALITSYTDSPILALPVVTERGGAALVDAGALFMGDIANLGLAADRSRSTWGEVKSFPENATVRVNLVTSGGRSSYYYAGASAPDPRGIQVVVHYGLSELPKDHEYQPRLADDRVGHFLDVIKSYDDPQALDQFKRYVRRWKLEKADRRAERSVPAEPIIFWIDKAVPRQYRPYVKAGILEWNKAFEKIGFVEAIQVRDQQASDDFDPEDIRYNTFRWIATGAGFAMGPSRSNPKTGQILDADILFDESMLRYWRWEYQTVLGDSTSLRAVQQGARLGWLRQYAAFLPLAVGREPQLNELWQQFQGKLEAERAAGGAPHDPELLRPHACGVCAGKRRQLGLLASVLVAKGALPPGGDLPEEFVGQALKEVVMHEVGHTLGLRHNFKASTMLSLAEINDPDITSVRGMSGSIMDYLPANIARKGEPQGEFFASTIGPYDYRAIEYAYHPTADEKVLAAIASRVAEPGQDFGTDEDMWYNPDPRINVFDLGDPLEFAQHQVNLVHDYLPGLAERVVAEGEGWQPVTDAFHMMMSELAQATVLASLHVGGMYNHRDHRGDANARPPFEMVPAAKQREALTWLADTILSERMVAFSPDLLQKLAPVYWSHWGEDGGYAEPYPLQRILLRLQQIALSQLLSTSTLRSIQSYEVIAWPDQDPLRLDEVFGSLTGAVFSDLPGAGGGALHLSTGRRNLQREYVRQLTSMVLGPRPGSDLFAVLLYGGASSAPADARSLARLHLRQIHDRLETVLASGATMTTVNQAHLEELRQLIGETLRAGLVINAP